MYRAASAVVALAAAATFAVSAVLQQRAARVLPSSESLTFRLFADLLRQPLWLAGTGSLILGYLLQGLALALGDVSYVAPLIVTELIFAVPLAARSENRRPGRRVWVGASGLVPGVGLFLGIASPHGGHPQPALLVWGLMVLSCAGVIAVAVVLAEHLPETKAEPDDPISARRAALLAVAAGVTFGLLAVFTKNVTYQLDHRGLGVVASWQLYGLIGVGIFGFLFSQSAYQASSLRNSLPVIDALEPTVAVLAAAAAFGEHLAHDPLSLAIELVGAVTAFAGVFLVGRSQLVTSIYQTA
jgi:drug/metabolite transporter (DMT)-like permease